MSSEVPIEIVCNDCKSVSSQPRVALPDIMFFSQTVKCLSSITERLVWQLRKDRRGLACWENNGSQI